MAVLRLQPAVKDYIWGGNKLREKYNKLSDKPIIAETWELSMHPDGLSVIAEGDHEGATLREVIEANPLNMLGAKCIKFDNFPLLVKLIDARDNLSIQVHPDDEYAAKYEGQQGKTEVWYIAEADEGAGIYRGFRHPITKEEFVKRIEDNTLLEVLEFEPVKKGDVFFIEAGTIHAICKGITVAEIQQSSNVTYRVFDYGRIGADGKPRELHIDKALDVTKLAPVDKSQNLTAVLAQNQRLIASCEYFHVEEVRCDGDSYRLETNICFAAVLVLEGLIEIIANDGARTFLTKGDTAFVSADERKVTVSGSGLFLKITI